MRGVHGGKLERVDLVWMGPGRWGPGQGEVEFRIVGAPDGLAASDRLLWESLLKRVCGLLGKAFGALSGAESVSEVGEG